MECDLLYEDEWCFVVNKAHNVLVHHSAYAGTSDEQSLVEFWRNRFPTAVLVHRLDRKTAGIVLFAKEKEYAAPFQRLWQNEEQTRKKYLALVRGHLNENGIVDTPVKNERGNSKEACTHYTTLLTLERPFPIVPYPSARYSIVEFELLTGRWHQLRQHANKIAHPIIGDPKHGNRHHNHYFQEHLDEHRMFLQAHSLQFNHPFTNKEVCIQIDQLSDPFKHFLTSAEQKLLAEKRKG